MQATPPRGMVAAALVGPSMAIKQHVTATFLERWSTPNDVVAPYLWLGAPLQGHPIWGDGRNSASICVEGKYLGHNRQTKEELYFTMKDVSMGCEYRIYREMIH